MRASIGGGKRLDPHEVFQREQRLDHVLGVDAPDAEKDEDILAPFTALAAKKSKESQ